MPTPSSNPPPDPSSPRSYSFSTCPDDSQLPSRASWQADEAQDRPNIEVQHDPSSNHSSSPVIDAIPVQEGPVGEDTVMFESRISDNPSSRGTTMSPRPQSSATGVTSPAPSGPDGDLIKGEGPDVDGQINGSSTEKQIVSDADPVQRSAGHMPVATAIDRDDGMVGVDAEEDELWSPCMGPDYSSMRVIPTSPSSYLRPGSRFHGTQQSERQVYDVQIEIKQVDMRESFLCGYLRIQGLTEDHPTLTTYFEGEIIGTKYNFFTEHEGWGASPKVDLSHWSKFNAFRPYQKQARKGPVTIRDVAQRENIFMRWKEHFLVPDHRVRTITGASFEGFYYICFNQIKGEVSGIYFHSKSEKFQQLELKHVSDHGCFAAMELR